jgi:HlyD family secretion protein
MAKWIIAGVCLLVAAFVGGLIFFGVHTQLEERVYEVRRGSLGRSARGLGKVESRTLVTPLAFSLSGRLMALNVAEGEKVEQGKVLAELDAAELEARLAAAKEALAEAGARERLVLDPPRPLELQALEAQITLADKELEAAGERLKNLLQPAAPPPAPKWQLDAAALEVERLKQAHSEAVSEQRRVTAGPSEDDLAVAEAKWRVAQVDVTDAEEKYRLLKEEDWPAPYRGRMNKWEQAAVAQNIERTRRRERLAQAEYDKVKRGPTQDEKEAAAARALAAKAAGDAALADLERLKAPQPPARGSDLEIALARNAQAQAEVRLQAAKGALELARAGPREAEKAAARAAVLRAEKTLEELCVQREQARLRAPFAGTVVERLHEPGVALPACAPVLILADLARLRVRAELDAVWSGQLRAGQKATLLGNMLSGAVQRVLEMAGPKTLFSQDPRETKGGEVVSLIVNLDAPQSEAAAASAAALRPGLRLDVKVDFEGRENVLSIPRAFVVYENGKYYVLKAESRAGERVGATKRVEVEIGWRDELNCEILSGLSEGDVLVKPKAGQ